MRLLKSFGWVAGAGSLVLAVAVPARAALIYSATGSPSLVGTETGDLGVLKSFTTDVTFTYVSGDTGVIIAELGQAAVNTGWHDSQVELASDGTIRVAVWPFNGGQGNANEINLGAAPLGSDTVQYSYDDTLQLLSAQVNGGPISTYAITRQDPISNGQSQQRFAFGAPESTSQSLGNANTFQAYSDTISSVQIYDVVPEPASLGFVALSTLGLLARRRSIR